MLRILVVLAITGLLVRLFLWWWPRRGGLSPKRAARALKAGNFGKKEERLARDLLKEAEIAAEAGDTRRALSALRELAPLILAQHWGRTVPANATEQDCIAVARQVLAGTHPTLSGPDDTVIQGVTATTRRADDAGGSGFLEGFEAIMRAWVRLAWAHREVEGRTLEEGLLWSRHWSMGGTHGS